jgi:hypothetical protein
LKLHPIHFSKEAQKMAYLYYNMVEKSEEKQYPTWKDSAPNLQTFLDAINKSQPIIGCKYELVWSRWPRTIFFAKGITIPGVSVNTIDINHAGFTIAIPTHVTYENTEITMQIIADKEGFHYYDLRNMVLQTGHPLVAGDPKATIGNPYGISPDEDVIDVRLRNQPGDNTHHHWIIHNFHPIGIGDMELGTDGASFVEFELKGTFTHISYDCGKTEEASSEESEEEQEEFEFGPIDEEDEDEDEEMPEDEYDEEDEPEEDEEDEEDYPDDETHYTDEEEEGEYSDYTEPPAENERPKESAMMSGDEMTVTNENGEEMSTSASSKVGVPNPASEKDQIMATVCNDELNEAN